MRNKGAWGDKGGCLAGLLFIGGIPLGFRGLIMLMNGELAGIGFLAGSVICELVSFAGPQIYDWISAHASSTRIEEEQRHREEERTRLEEEQRRRDEERVRFEQEQRRRQEARARFERDSRVKERYYEILGVSRNATQDEIKKAYRDKIKEYHPDRFMNQPEWVRKEAEEISKKLNKAYEVLGDPNKRKENDRGL